MNWITWGTLPPSGRAGTLTSFNNIVFDHAAYSRLGPLLRFSTRSVQPVPTPVLFDVHADCCETYDVQSFLERMARAGANKTTRLPILGVLAATDFSKTAWREGKSAGLMMVNFRMLFGESALEVMVAVEKSLQRICSNAGQPDPGAVEHLAATLEMTAANPIIQDLRSISFEVLAGLLLGMGGWEGVELNCKVPFRLADGSVVEREVDVAANRKGGEELYLIECKGEAQGQSLDPEYVRKFFCEAVPAYVRLRRAICPPRVVQAEIWTTGDVGEAARLRLKQLKLPSTLKPALRDGQELKESLPRSLHGCRRLLAAIAWPARPLCSLRDDSAFRRFSRTAERSFLWTI